MHKSIHKPCLWALLADAGTKTRSGNTTDNRYNWFIEARLIVVVSMKGTSRSTCYQTGFGESIIGGGKPISDLLTSGLQSAHRHYHLDVHLIWTFESPLIIRRWHCVVDLSIYIPLPASWPKIFHLATLLVSLGILIALAESDPKYGDGNVKKIGIESISSLSVTERKFIASSYNLIFCPKWIIPVLYSFIYLCEIHKIFLSQLSPLVDWMSSLYQICWVGYKIKTVSNEQNRRFNANSEPPLVKRKEKI